MSSRRGSKKVRAFVKSHPTKRLGNRGLLTNPKLGALRAQSSGLKSAKMAAARMLANASTAGFLGIEKKFLDTTKTDTPVAGIVGLTGGEYDPSGGCTGCLSCPAQGDTEQSRDGKRIVVDSVILKGHVRLNENAGAAQLDSLKVFVAVILDTQTNGSQLNSEDVFKNLSAQITSVVEPMKNLLFGNRFRILKSQVFDLTPSGLSTAGGTSAWCGVQREFDWYIPFKGGLPVNLNAGTTADVANVIDNSIHVVAFATINATAEIGYNARIRFQG